VLALAVATGQPAPLFAQDQADPQATIEEAAELIGQLVQIDASLALLDELAGTVTDLERPQVDRRVASYAAERRQVVWDLAELAGQLPADSASQQTAAFADSVLAAELAVIEAEARALSGEVTTLRETQKEAAPGTQLELEVQIAALDARIEQAISDFVDTVQRLEERGIAPSPAVAQLDRFLVGRAELALAGIDLASEQAERLQQAIEAGADADTEARLLVVNARGANEIQALRATLDVMDRRELDTSAFREELLVRSGGFSAEDLDVQVLAQLIRRGTGAATGWLADNGGSLLFRTLSFFAILFVFWVLAGFVRKVARRAVSTSRLDVSKLLQDTFVSWTGRLVVLVGLLIALSQVGLNLGPVLAGLGVAGFIVGFALQDTLANFAAGLMILIYRPFDVDDLVEAAGQFGTVSAMSLVSTTLLTIDNQRLIVPNSQIWGGVIRNVTAQRLRRVDMVFGIGYSDDIPKAEGVLNRLVEEHPKVLDDPAPTVKVHQLGESSVDFVVRPWCKTDDYWDVHWDITRAVKMTFDAEGISIPFPQRDVHLFQEESAD
jgi:small conductance mechanosensitive channel